MRRIYLDNNATTALDGRVLEAMLEDLSSGASNPSSVHFFGQRARQKLQKARSSIALFFGVKPNEILFSSGGTESINMLIRGILGNHLQGHVISSDLEHSCVYRTLKAVDHARFDVTFLGGGLWGAIKPDQVGSAITPETKLIVLGAVNGETGVKTDIRLIAEIAKKHRIPFVVDGVALLGKESFTIPEGVSAMAFSAHKLHGPKGVGLAFVRSGIKFSPLITGGDQEYSKRAGTENLSGILGFAKAIDLLKIELPSATLKMQTLRDRLESGLKGSVGNIMINGSGPRVVNTLNVSFPDVDGETLLIQLDLAGIAASHGSACSSGALKPSRVLTNMGINHKTARSSIRFSLSRETCEEEIDHAIDIITETVGQLKKLSYN